MIGCSETTDLTSSFYDEYVDDTFVVATTQEDYKIDTEEKEIYDELKITCFAFFLDFYQIIFFTENLKFTRDTKIFLLMIGRLNHQ